MHEPSPGLRIGLAVGQELRFDAVRPGEPGQLFEVEHDRLALHVAGPVAEHLLDPLAHLPAQRRPGDRVLVQRRQHHAPCCSAVRLASIEVTFGAVGGAASGPGSNPGSSHGANRIRIAERALPRRRQPEAIKAAADLRQRQILGPVVKDPQRVERELQIADRPVRRSSDPECTTTVPAVAQLLAPLRRPGPIFSFASAGCAAPPAQARECQFSRRASGCSPGGAVSDPSEAVQASSAANPVRVPRAPALIRSQVETAWVTPHPFVASRGGLWWAVDLGVVRSGSHAGVSWCSSARSRARISIRCTACMLVRIVGM